MIKNYLLLSVLLIYNYSISQCIVDNQIYGFIQDETLCNGSLGGSEFNENSTQSTENCDGVVYIPDVNFKNYLINNYSINTNGNTEIECHEAQSFNGSILAYNLNISDLTGIEAFTNVTTIYIPANNLTSLDLSNNLALQTLFVLSNSITSLDVSNNVNLINLHCEYNQISSLDVSQNTFLKNLNCGYNSITHLDLSNNPNLTYLDAWNNELTSLNIKNGNNINFSEFNVTNNPNLYCIEVDDASWSASNWTDIPSTASFSEDCSTCSSVITYNGNWQQTPDETTRVVVSDSLVISSDLEICEIEVTNTGSVIIENGATLTVNNRVVNNGTFIVEHNANLIQVNNVENQG